MGIFTKLFAKNAVTSKSTNRSQSSENIAEGYTYYKKGYREDLLQYMKSKMEANVYRWYRWKVSKGDIISVQYEPDMFRVETEQGKKEYYVPDFKVTTRQGVYYVEVKGPRDHPSLKKTRALSKDRRGIKIVCIFPEQYEKIKKLYSHRVPYWE